MILMMIYHICAVSRCLMFDFFFFEMERVFSLFFSKWRTILGWSIGSLYASVTVLLIFMMCFAKIGKGEEIKVDDIVEEFVLVEKHKKKKKKKNNRHRKKKHDVSMDEDVTEDLDKLDFEKTPVSLRDKDMTPPTLHTVQTVHVGKPISAHMRATPSSAAKNFPVETDEDRSIANQVIEVGERKVIVDILYDGHGGSFASDFLSRNSVEYVKRELLCDTKVSLFELVRRSIAKLEHDLLRELCWLEKRDGAAGSMVLTELRNEEDLYVACGNLGDCDVMMFSKQDWQMLSETHRASNESEKRRILGLGGYLVNGSRLVHLVKYREPEDDEERVEDYHAKGIAWNGHLMYNIECTRSFGDYLWKQEKGIANTFVVQEHVTKNSEEWKRISRNLYRLLSSEPFVKVVKAKKSDEYVVIASDGFWDAFPGHASLRDYIYEHNLHMMDTESLSDEIGKVARQRHPKGSKGADDVSVVVINIEQRVEESRKRKQDRKNLLELFNETMK